MRDRLGRWELRDLTLAQEGNLGHQGLSCKGLELLVLEVLALAQVTVLAALAVEEELAVPGPSAVEAVTHWEAPRLGKATVALESVALAAHPEPVPNVALLEQVPELVQLALDLNAVLQLLAQELQPAQERGRVRVAPVLVQHVKALKALQPLGFR